MPLPVPHLDDRDFARLLEDARALIPSRSPEWSDFTPGDPGMVLLELFAFLTDTMLYRLNRLPEKAYVAFLNLIGVQLEPPMAASVTLRFDAAESLTDPVTIPRGTRVTVGAGRSGGEDPVFATTEEVVVAPGGTAEVTALHGDAVEAELIGTGTGGPGQRVQVASPPIIHRTIDGLELIVGVEATASELGEREPAVTYDGRAFRIWQEVSGFAAAGPDPHVYVVDRTTGTITFSPAVRGTTERGLDLAAAPVAAVPGSGREIRVWYRHGGGVAGNVAAGTLTTLRVRIPGVTVTNPAPATGGRDTESLANTLVRGPQQLHAVERAVTARDFELAALASSGAVARAKAFTRAELWTHAVPGTVEVLLVPAPPPGADVGISARDVEARQTTDALATVRADLDARAPMGTRREVGWTRYKTVRVTARVVVHRAEDVDAVRRRMIERLQRTINPVPTGELRGWRYGEALRAFHIYDALLAERGVRYVDGVRLIVDETPDDVRALEADPSQPNTWYCASGPILFRSLDNAGGWEPSGRFEGETVEIVRTSKHQPGLVLVASRVGASERSRLRVSTDCGETWEAAAELDFHVEDMTIVRRDDGLLAFLATDRGLYELPLRRAAVPVQILVDPARPDLGFYAVAAITSDQGDLNIAVAAQELGGVAISGLDGRPGTFRPLGSLQGKDIRVLFVREEGPRRFLIAGVTVSGAAPGEGAHMVEIVGVQISPQGWQPLTSGWQAGSCQSLAMQGRTILAASHAGGVMRLDLSVAQPAWEPSSVDCGLAMRDPGRFAPLTTVVAGPDARDRDGRRTAHRRRGRRRPSQRRRWRDLPLGL